MKSVIALLISATAAVSVGDAPSYWPGPTWTENHPSAAGLVQVQTTSCMEAGVVGVTCGPSDDELFATGMNGDEDLGQDITMKGEKFHYQQMAQGQWTPVVVKQAEGTLPECHGNNGAPGVNCKAPACTGTNGPLDGPTGTPCTLEEPAAIPHYNTDPVAGRPYATSGNLTPQDPSPPVPAQIVLQTAAEPAAPAEAAPAAEAPAAAAEAPAAEGAEKPAVEAKEPAAAAAEGAKGAKGAKAAPIPLPEKVSVLDPKIAKTHTSFYGQSE